MSASDKPDEMIAAMLSYENGDYTETIEILRRFPGTDGSNPDVLCLMGKALAAINDYANAAVCFHKTIVSIQNLLEVNSLSGALKRLENKGFRPASVLDIGAFDGMWTRTAMKIMPDAEFIMVEAQPDMEKLLRGVVDDFPEKASYHMALLGAAQKDGVEFQIMETGSSVYSEQTTYKRETVELPMIRLDKILSSPKSPAMMKLDVQGSELDIITGSGGILEPIEVMIVECATLEYNKGAPLISDTISYMNKIGFRPFDIIDLTRGKNGILFHLDIVFTRNNSDLIPSGILW